MKNLLQILGALFFSIASLTYVSIAWFKNYRAYELLFYHYRETPPDEYPPAVLGCLWHFGRPTWQDLCGAITHLASRGYLKIQEKTVKHKESYGETVDFSYKIISKKQDHEDLPKYERSIIEYIENWGDKRGLDLAELVASPKKSREFYHFFTVWAKSVRSQVEEDGSGYDGIGPYTLTLALSIAIGTMGLGMVFMGFVGGMMPFVTAILQMTLANVFHRDWGMDPAKYREWTAFRLYLKKLGEKPGTELPDLATAEQYLILSLPLGCNMEMFYALEKIVRLENQPRAFLWVDVLHHLEGRTRLAQAAGFISQFSIVTRRISMMAKKKQRDILDLPIIRIFYKP